MKKTLSFKKDITFKTMIGEITTISLEDDLKFIDGSNIVGNFYVSGKYKMYDASTIVEDFSYSIPLSVELIEKLDLDTAKISINNFTYEVIDNSILRCKIDTLVEGVEEIDVKEELERDCDDDIVPDELKEIPVKDDSKREKIEVEAENEEVVEKPKNNIVKVNSLFANLGEENDTFTTYSVYIMREEDTIEKVMDKYKVSKEELQNYNDLSTIELNSKVIIPSSIENE